MRVIHPGDTFNALVQLNPQADSGNVMWTLRGHAGQELTSGSVKVNNTDFEVPIEIVGAFNSKTLPVENRFLRVAWVERKRHHFSDLFYSIVDFIPLPLLPEDVRTVLSANNAELPDREIDLVTAAYFVREDMGATRFNEMIASGGIGSLQLARMVCLWCAASFATTLPFRMVQSMSNESARFDRFKGIDFQAIVAGLRAEYQGLKNQLVVPAQDQFDLPFLFTTAGTFKELPTCRNFPTSFPALLPK